MCTGIVFRKIELAVQLDRIERGHIDVISPRLTRKAVAKL